MSLNLYTYCHNEPVMYVDPDGHAELKKGMRGDSVTELQRMLVKEGYLKIPKGVAYGYFGDLTEAALKKYQKDHKLKVDGRADNSDMRSIYYNSLPKEIPEVARQNAASSKYPVKPAVSKSYLPEVAKKNPTNVVGKEGDNIIKKQSIDKQYAPPILSGVITSPYGNRIDPLDKPKKKEKFHSGIDVGAKEGTPIYAVTDGVVALKKNKDNNEDKILNDGYGYYIDLKFNNGAGEARYAHLSKYATGLKSGTIVKKGQIIGYVGNTGASSGEHLHFELRLYDAEDRRIAPKGREYVEKNTVDPAKYIYFNLKYK